MITEKDNVFYCDCGFSFQRGRSGAHDCADGLRNKLVESEARCAALAAENAGLKESRKNLAEFIHEELDAGYPLNMDIETPATDAFLAEVRAQGVEAFASVLEARGKHHEYVEIANAYASILRKGVQS